MNRKCIECEEVRRTTNKQNPYLCELCLRSIGRLMMLAPRDNKLAWKGAFWLILLFVIGFVIGYFI